MCVLGRAAKPWKELAANYVWLKPLCKHFPRSVPGAMFLTDVMLMVDELLDKTLLVRKNLHKVDQASEEAGRLKRCMGALRYLFRNRP